MKPNLSLQANHLLGLSDDELKWAIVNCLSADPCLWNLTLNGFQPALSPEALSQERVELISPQSLAQLRSVCAYFLRHVQALEELPTHWYRKTTSYGHKHAVEALMGAGCANGIMILAAALAGIRWEKIEGTPNCYLGLSEPPSRLLPPFPSPQRGDPPKAGRGDDVRRSA